MFKNVDWVEFSLIGFLMAVVAGLVGFTAWFFIHDATTEDPTGKYEVVSYDTYLRSVKPIVYGCEVQVLDKDGNQFEAHGPRSVCDQIQPGQFILLEDGDVVTDFWGTLPENQ